MIEHRGEAVGKAGIWREDEIGFLLFRSAWRQGFAAESAAAVIARAFERGLQRISAEADPHNARSLRLLARLGFEHTGYRHRSMQIDGVWFDSVYLELLRPHA